MAVQDPKEAEPSTSAVMSELKKSSDGTNVLKEYKDIFSKDKSTGSDLKSDRIVDEGDALASLKSMIDAKKGSLPENKRKKWDFPTSPHAQFGKTIDDTYGAFLAWARAKGEEGRVNVTKAFRRLESYADWMEGTGTDLTEPPLTPASVKKAVESWAFSTSVDAAGRLVWWIDVARLDVKHVKKDFTPEDHLRAYAWYAHAVLYDASAQENGLVFVENMNKLGMVECFTLMPMKLATKLDRLTIGVLPVRMQCMYMIETPTWVNVFMKILGMFMSKKMKERMVFLKEWKEMERLGGPEAIPKGFGKSNGTMETSVIEDTYFAS